MGSEKLGTCDAHVLGRYGYHMKHDDCANWREQPQGEASRRRFGMFIHDSTCAVFALDNKVQHTCDCGHAVPVQTEGGEKRCPFVDNYRVNPHGCFETDLTDGGDYSPNRWVIHGKTCPRYVESPASQKWHEPSSPPAPAGTPREFVIEWAKRHKETYLQVDDIAACAEAYTAEQVRQADAWKKVAEERKKLADSLLDEVTQLRQERDARNNAIENLKTALRLTDEARERAEKALREATRDGKWIYCTVKRHDALAELAEALAHVKSSEGTK